MSRLLNLVKKEFIQIRRTRAMLGIVLGMPVIQLLILGFALSGDVVNVPTALVDMDRSVSSRMITDKLSSTRYLDIKFVSDDPKKAKDNLEHENSIVVVTIPENFEKDMMKGDYPAISVLADAQNSNIAITAASYVRNIIFSWALERGVIKSSNRIKNINIEPRIWFNPELKTVYYMVPGIIVLLVTIVTIMLTALAIVRERESGTLEQLLVTPINKTEFILGKTIPFGIVGMVELCVALLAGFLIYRIIIAGSLLLFLSISVLYMFCTLGIGILISTVTNTQQQALFTAWFIMIFFILMSGFILPLENMPKIMYYISFIDPLRFLVAVVRGIFLKGCGAADLVWEIFAIFMWGLIYMTAAIMRFQKRIG